MFAMDLRRVLLAGLFNFSLAVLAGLFGATQTLGDVAGFDFFARRFWREALDAGSPIADLILAHQIVAVLAGTRAAGRARPRHRGRPHASCATIASGSTAPRPGCAAAAGCSP